MIDTLESAGRARLTPDGRSVSFADSGLTPLDFVTRVWNATPDLGVLAAAKSGRTRGETHAYVNHGRWVVDCPDPDCPGALLASDTERLFVCPYCNFGPFDVTFPADREKVEAVLLDRPVKETRNWVPGETVDDLRAENEARLQHRKGA